MARRISSAHRDAQNNARAAAFNSGFFDVYTGTQPATADTAASGTLLVSIPLAATAFGATSGGTAPLTGTPSATAVAGGVAGWGRLRNSGDTRREDGAVGTEFTLDNTNIVQGGTVTLTSLALSKQLS